MAEDETRSPTDPGPHSRGRRLNSWKQIARYLNRHVTTVRRWERCERLPVHRHLHKQLGSIYAYTNELDAWFESRRRDSAGFDDDALPDAGFAGLAPSGPAGGRENQPAGIQSSLTGATIATASGERFTNTEGDAPLHPEGAGSGGMSPLVSFRRRVARSRGTLVGALALVSVVAAVWMGARLGAATPGASASPSVYDQLVRADFFFNRRQPGDLERAETAYRQALALQPGSARAWAGLAGVYYIAAQRPRQLGLTREGALERVRDNADRALVLDPNLAEAHIRLANFLFDKGDAPGALQHIQRAMKLDPDNPIALGNLAGIALSDGHAEEAVELQRRALRRDPLSLVARANLGTSLFLAGRFEEATTELKAVLEMSGPPASPDDDFTLGVGWRFARSLIAQQRFVEAAAFVDSWPDTIFHDDVLALAQEGLGHEAEASVALRRMSTATSAEARALIAEVYANRGDAEQAFRWLDAASEQARRSGEPWQPWKLDVRYSPFFASVRGDPRWAAWLLENPAPL